MTGTHDQTDTADVDRLMAALTKGGGDRAESRLLDPFVGRWDALTEWEPVVGKGIRRSEDRAEATWILGGRVLEIRHQATDGSERARLMVGFDPSSNDYAGFAASILSSFFAIERGRYDVESASLELDGEEPAPRRNTVIHYRRTLRLVDPDTFTMAISYPRVPLGTYGPMLVTHRRVG